MSALPPIKRITREDLRDAPSWVDRLLYPINLFMDSVYGSMNHLLTFQDNFVSQIQTFQIVGAASAAGNTVKFLLTMKKRPQYMVVLSVSANNASDITTGGPNAVSWNYDGTNVNITSITGLTNSTTYNISLLLI